MFLFFSPSIQKITTSQHKCLGTLIVYIYILTYIIIRIEDLLVSTYVVQSLLFFKIPKECIVLKESVY